MSDFGTKPNGTPYLIPLDDPRRQPRLTPSKRKSRFISIQVTETEFAAIRAMAKKAHSSIRDLVVARVLGLTV